MANIIVYTDMMVGEVKITCNTEDGESCETHFVWHNPHAELEGFVIKKDTCGVLPWEEGGLIPITDLAAEIFLNEYVGLLSKCTGIGDVSFWHNDGIKMKRLSFMPPTVTDDELAREFPELQDTLEEIYSEYAREGRITADQIQSADDNDVLEDFVSLLNFDKFLAVHILGRKVV